jgi:hypothetical protein
MNTYAGNVPILAQVNPVSVAAAGTQVTGWVDVSQAARIRTLVQCGAGGGTPAITWQQGNTSSGGGAKSLSWGAGSYASNRIDVENTTESVDLINGFRWVQGTVTMTGGTGTITGTTVFAEDPTSSS